MSIIVKIIDGNKLCTKCKEWLPVDKFGLNPKLKSGYNSQCRSCVNKGSNLYYEKKGPIVTIHNGHKSCSLCKKLLPFDNFYEDSKIKSGYSSRCRSCTSTVRKKNPTLKIIDGHKLCNKCNQLLPVEKFNKNPKTKCGLKGNCIECGKELSRQYKLKADDETRKRRNRQSYDCNLRRMEWDVEYFENTKRKKWERVQYKLNNDNEYKTKRQKYSREFAKHRRKNDPLFYLKTTIGNTIRTSFKRGGFSKSTKTYKILGIDYNGFMKHIESQFVNGMSWDNRGEWALDHKIPISLGKTVDDIIRLNHYSNFQPLWKKENILKSNKILPEFEHLIDEYII